MSQPPLAHLLSQPAPLATVPQASLSAVSMASSSSHSSSAAASSPPSNAATNKTALAGPDRSTKDRKEQNRNAQRAFRERREKYVKDLETRVASLVAAQSENDKLLGHLSALERENLSLKHELHAHAEQLQSHSHVCPLMSRLPPPPPSPALSQTSSQLSATSPSTSVHPIPPSALHPIHLPSVAALNLPPSSHANGSRSPSPLPPPLPHSAPPASAPSPAFPPIVEPSNGDMSIRMSPSSIGTLGFGGLSGSHSRGVALGGASLPPSSYQESASRTTY